MINVYPSIQGINQLYIEHRIKFKFLSKTPKENCFAIMGSRFKSSQEQSLLLRNTESIKEIEDLLYNFIEKQEIPNMSNWIELKLYS